MASLPQRHIYLQHFIKRESKIQLFVRFFRDLVKFLMSFIIALDILWIEVNFWS